MTYSLSDALTALELTSSKICHDLISPVGALNNGLEFLADMDEDGSNDEVIELLKHSADVASARLQVFRIAYGAGGNDFGLKPEDVHTVFQKLFGSDKRITQEWNPKDQDYFSDDRLMALPKLLANGLIVAADCLPKGGHITIAPEKGGAVFKVSGQDVRFRKDVEPILLGENVEIQQLTPHTIHAYALYAFTQRSEGRIAITEKTAEHLTFKFF